MDLDYDSEREFALLAETEDARFAAAHEVWAAQGYTEPATLNGLPEHERTMYAALAPRNDADMLAWFYSDPVRTVNGGDWNGGCEAAMSVGGHLVGYPSAVLAGNASGPLNLNQGAAVGSEFDFWSGIWDITTKTWLGHVTWRDPRDPRFILGASKTMALLGQPLGHSLGRCLIADYQRLTALPYRGHTLRHGTQTIARTIPAGGGGVTPITNTNGSDSDMYCIGLDQGLPTAVSFSIGVGILQRHSQARQQELAAAQAQQPGGCYWYPDENDFLRTMWNHGLGEFTLAQARALQGNDHLIARAVFGAYAPTLTLTDAQIAAIGAGVKAPTVDLTPILTAVANLDTQADGYQTALVNAITSAAASIPGATLDLEASRLKS